MLSRVLMAGNASVASEHPLASLAGYDVLRSGGNAFDAAVATSFALAVTMHQIAGLGGDFFGMFYEAKSGKVLCLNSSGWAPTGLTMDLIRSKGGPEIPTFGPLTCMIPGQVAGLWAMHRKLGRGEWKPLLNTAKRLASEGFPASESYCRSTASTIGHFSPEARSVFAPFGAPPSPGTWIRQEGLGRLIGDLASDGPGVLYGGWAAGQIQDVLQSLGVPADLSDFRDYGPEWVDPITLDYHGTLVHETPPNSIGATCLLMLKMLSQKPLSETGPLSKERIDLTMNAAEVAYQRKDKMLCDPRFHKIDMDEFMKIPPIEGHYKGKVFPGDTTAFSIADNDGNVVSGIQSLFRHFGSRVFVPGCGIMLNDRGSGFHVDGPNKVEPRKRPLHTLSSLILQRGDSTTAIGTSGGDYRPIQHTLFITNLVDFKMSLEEAVEHPRFLWSEGRSLTVEAGYEEPDSSRYDVEKVPMPSRTGVCQAIEVRGRSHRAVCDVRGDGIPAGF
jgi:gamma-glutamyltranspeptidase / glutathione hydrolase